MSEGKMGTYLKYAIGEVVLVVIGILIALWLNNWNESRKDRVKEAFYLEQIKQELIIQKLEFEKGKNYSFGRKANADTLQIRFYESGFIGSTEFNGSLFQLISAPNFKLRNTVFNDLKSTGQLEVIRNDSLRKQLIQSYEELEIVSREIQNNNNHVFYPKVFDRLLSYIDMNYPAALKKEHNLRLNNSTSLLELYESLTIARLCYFAYDNILTQGEQELDKALAMLTEAGVE